MEMVVASVGLLYGFPASDYRPGGPQAGSPESSKGVGANLKNVSDHFSSSGACTGERWFVSHSMTK